MREVYLTLTREAMRPVYGRVFWKGSESFFGICGVVGMKGSPIIITYILLFVNKRRNECGLQGGGSPQRYFLFIITYILLFVKFILRADAMKVIFFR